MSDLDLIVDRICEAAGADFAFVLTRRGRLVTQRAPADMPEEGRMQLVAAAERVLTGEEGGTGLTYLQLPRQALVPYGGAAPVDVYIAPRDEAIICVVMATYAQQHKVGPAVAGGLVELDALLEHENDKRARRRGHKPAPPPPPPKPTSSRGRRTNRPPALDFDDSNPSPRGTIPFMQPYRPSRKITPPPMPPEISVGEAPLGRATLAAIEVDAESPDITYGMASIGRQTVAEIELSMLPSGDPRSSIPDVRVSVTSISETERRGSDPLDRQTLPFTESVDDLKKSFEEGAPHKVVVVEAPAARAPSTPDNLPRDTVPDLPRAADDEGPVISAEVMETALTLTQSPQRTVVVGSSSTKPTKRKAFAGLQGGAKPVVAAIGPSRGAKSTPPRAATPPPPPREDEPRSRRDSRTQPEMAVVRGAARDSSAGDAPASSNRSAKTVPEMAAVSTRGGSPNSAPAESGEQPVADRLPRDSGIELWHAALGAMASRPPPQKPEAAPEKAPARQRTTTRPPKR
ncbi:MAG: hypothetical protein U0271_44500 [Polyangiaceae bacterium]